MRSQLTKQIEVSTEVKQETNQIQSFTEDLGNDIKLEMTAIPGGKFLMGTEDQEIARLCKKYDKEYFNREKPQHEVTVQSFQMGKYPITQAQYQQIMGENPSNFKGDKLPVESISWEDAVEFCHKLTIRKGTEYRLPTEAEWEYACRAGTTTPYHFGKDITDKLANHGGSVGQTTTVGLYRANAFGLHDMHGNVWEWCQDDWHDNYQDAPTDGRVWVLEKSSTKPIRGGSWSYDPLDCRSAIRFNDSRLNRFSDIGFRVMCVAFITM